MSETQNRSGKAPSLPSTLSAALLGLSLWGSQTNLLAATIPVTSLADSGPGSLRDVIATAAPGDTIDATGIAGTITLASELVVDKSLTLHGPGQDELILSGNQATRVLHLSSATSTVNISGLTVADGHQSSPPAPDDFSSASGGIFSRATLTLSDCTIRGNSILSDAGWYGGGVTSLGPLTVTHCLISGNSGDAAQRGGGIVTRGAGATTVVDSTIVHNGTTGIYASSLGGAFISRCTLSGNTSEGMVLVSQVWTVDQCTLSGNGQYGLEFGQAGKILNSTIVGHRVGLIGNPSTGAGVIGNTIFDNERDTNQRNFPTQNDKAPISLGHNITRGNAGGDASTGPGGWLNQPTDRRNTDPLLGPLQNNGGPTPTHALLPGSPAINAGGGSDELQSFRVSGSAGTFTLTFNGATTDPLPFNATAAEVQDALNALSSIGGVGGSVAVVRNPEHGNNFFVSFSTGTLAAQDQPLMTGSGSGGTSVSRPFAISNGGPLPAVDQRGFPRVVNGRVDIGAFEFAAPVAVADTITRPNTTRVAKVLRSVLLGNDLEGDGDPMTITVVENALPTGATVVLAGNFVVYTAPPASAGNGSFTYTVSDGSFTSTATVTVSEAAPAGPAPGGPSAVKILPSGPDFIVSFVGVPGNGYRVQYTTGNAAPYSWNEFSPPAIYTAPAGTVFTHTDVAPTEPMRLYRAVANP